MEGIAWRRIEQLRFSIIRVAVMGIALGHLESEV